MAGIYGGGIGGGFEGAHGGPYAIGAQGASGGQNFQHGSGAVLNRDDATGGNVGRGFPPLRPEAAGIDWSIFQRPIEVGAGGGGLGVAWWCVLAVSFELCAMCMCVSCMAVRL